jgi:hypothetical protein
MATAKKRPRTKKKTGSPGSIHIKPSKEGSFKSMAKRAGKSVQAEASAVLASPDASPVAKKKANFARNASKWKKG